MKVLDFIITKNIISKIPERASIVLEGKSKPNVNNSWDLQCRLKENMDETDTLVYTTLFQVSPPNNDTLKIY